MTLTWQEDDRCDGRSSFSMPKTRKTPSKMRRSRLSCLTQKAYDKVDDRPQNNVVNPGRSDGSCSPGFRPVRASLFLAVTSSLSSHGISLPSTAERSQGVENVLARPRQPILPRPAIFEKTAKPSFGSILPLILYTQEKLPHLLTIYKFLN